MWISWGWLSFKEAAEIVKNVTVPTNLVYSDYFSKQTGNKIYIKPENLQFTGAYKVRGAYYKISTLSKEERFKKFIDYNCKICKNKNTDLCNISISVVKDIIMTKCAYYERKNWFRYLHKNQM